MQNLPLFPPGDHRMLHAIYRTKTRFVIVVHQVEGGLVAIASGIHPHPLSFVALTLLLIALQRGGIVRQTHPSILGPGSHG